MTHRPYRDARDLDGMMRVLQRGISTSPDSGYMHPGDLQWRACRPRGYDLAEMLEVWEEGDHIVGFGFLESASEYSAQVLPERRGSALEQEILGWCHDAVLGWRAANGYEPMCTTEAFADDAARLDVLESMGYRPSGTGFVAFHRLLDEIVAPQLPNVFVVRGLREEDIDSRATCQYEAFSPGSTTTPAVWRGLMASAPGYDSDLDTVVVARDGTVVAAALAWVDPHSRVGLFEPVATRPSFQRGGFGRAALQRGLQAMQAHGMRTAFVSTNASNIAARALYARVGFTDRNHGFEYVWKA